MIGSPKQLPRYLKFAQQLQTHIQSGQFLPGDKLPSQRELAEQFGTTLMTIRKGLNILAEEGVIRIEHGVGTFVNSPNLAEDDFQLLSFSSTLQQRPVGDTLTRPLETQSAVMHDKARLGLKLPAGQHPALLSRLRLLDGVPFAYQNSYLPPSLYAVAENYTAQSSLYQMLQDTLGQPVTMAREVIMPIVLTVEQAAHLLCEEGLPGWLSIRISATADGTPILYDEAILKHDHFVITLEHSGRRTTCQLQMVDGQSPNIFDYLTEE
ncbi:MAG: GntR family transcriptional regulator [Chloroflexota bacterium]